MILYMCICIRLHRTSKRDNRKLFHYLAFYNSKRIKGLGTRETQSTRITYRIILMFTSHATHYVGSDSPIHS